MITNSAKKEKGNKEGKLLKETFNFDNEKYKKEVNIIVKLMKMKIFSFWKKNRKSNRKYWYEWENWETKTSLNIKVLVKIVKK